MSRAFVLENDSWEYCPKAGERCMMAQKGRECKDTSCEHASKTVLSDDKPVPEKRDKFVRVNRENNKVK